MGRQIAREVERKYPMYRDPGVVEYISELGGRLAQISDRRDVRYRFQVVDSKEVNAFALPGGYIYVNKGLILASDNEAELAGVIGHEIGHVVGRHGAARLSMMYGYDLLATVLLGPNPAFWKALVADLFGTAGLLAYSRADESEADELGVRYLYRSGYDPGAMIAFFQKLLALQKREPDLLEKSFSSHPPTSERIAKVRGDIAHLPPREGQIQDSDYFQHVKARIREREERKSRQ
ncbi:MAG: M48 family metalloprotease [candidate division NC10 bacterium]|nr:M48 family metalloprotease [candidate division NC10 bacterium]